MVTGRGGERLGGSMRKHPLTRAVAVAVAILLGSRAEAGERVRWLLAVGSNEGGDGHTPLRHAVHDAEAFAEVFTTIGGVDRARALVLREPSPDRIREATAMLAAGVAEGRARGEEAEVVVYFSGHADDRGLLPSGVRVGWDHLGPALRALDVALGVVVVDACGAGALLSEAGASARSAARRRQGGEVVLVSSGAEEASQESVRLGGARFTYHLLVGLRGAADRSADGRVTLREAWTYARHHTVRHLDPARIPRQHPGGLAEGVGADDLVLTDLRGVRERVVLAAPWFGTVTLRDAQGRMVGELDKRRGRELVYALPAGTYTLRLEARGGAWPAGLVVPPGATVRVEDGAWSAEGEAPRVPWRRPSR